MSYHHLTIEERESILIYRTQGLNISEIATLLNRHPSSISRELRRHSTGETYSPSAAQAAYRISKSHSGRKRKLEVDSKLSQTIMHLFLDCQWSPEEIAGRLHLEHGMPIISYQTIYRAIYRGHFDDTSLSHGARGVIRKLRHRGKTRHTKNHIEKRGKIAISHTIHQRPQEAKLRSRIGDWEADTVAGKTGKACLVTLTDRHSRFLKIKKVTVKKSRLVIEAMIQLLEPLPRETVTPDRGKEFSRHKELTDKLQVEVYFPDPHAPWQRGTNENTNGLLREYFPKGSDLTDVEETVIQEWEDKLNYRPRKCLNWKTPYEVFYQKTVHLI
ncbi:TPA: IS30 family transposase [Streptococcus suis]|nr:IS30 family transposase [Streptococcus suis]HEL1827956.1 IS30 family transposase [Streptococcus suis]